MDPEEIDHSLKDLETRMERLRSLYSQFFMGIEAAEPTVARKEVDRRFWQLRKVQLRNTARKFRLQMLIQRYNTLQQFWGRTLRQIEAGRYRPHLQKVERRLGTDAVIALKTGHAEETTEVQEDPTRRELAETMRLQLEQDLEAALDDPFSLEAPGAELAPPQPATRPIPEKVQISSTRLRAQRSSRPAEQTATKQKPPVTLASGASIRAGEPGPLSGAPDQRPSPSKKRASLSSGRIQEIHAELNRVRRKLKASRDVSLQALDQELRLQERKLRMKHPGKSVDFAVTVRNGKAVLKPSVR